MGKCVNCNKNIAVIFITKIENGKHFQEGYCLSCAKNMGIQPLNEILNKTGLTDVDIQDLNDQMGSMLDQLQTGELSFEDIIAAGGNQIGNIFPNEDDSDDEEFDIDEKEEEITAKGNFPGFFSPDVNRTSREKSKERPKKKKYLDTFGSNINRRAMEGKIDKIIGRKDEIDRVIQILNRRAKNNPCLIGEPGVGKTAIAEGLAVKIVNNEVPAKLADKEVYLLDMTSIVAGTQFRGQFESRMKGIIEEAKKLKNIILVIDEIHNIIGAGDAEGSMNAANILKPSLAKGEIQVIGATTLEEYRRHIEKDSALERRFQPVIVEEPSVDESIEILKGIKYYYEDYHRVRISDEVVKAAVEMSERYIFDRFLPDKAIDVIDEAGSKRNLKNTQLLKLEQTKKQLAEVRTQIDSVMSEPEKDVYQYVADLKVKECQYLEEITKLEDRTSDPEITIDDIASVIESWTKIPVKKITEQEASKLISLDERLKKRVIGQDEAVTKLSKTIRRNRAGFKKKKKPASFIFIGPTGVGKTELVRALASELFESEEAIIRLDMSEYMEKHTVSKLIGSPPGYVGYDDGGQLTEKVRRKPYSVVLLDEIEKAHADIFNILLQILDEGRLTDSHGRLVNFENTVIIMTSNAGAHLKQGAIGFTSDAEKSMEQKQIDVLKDTFRPEFLNRIDEICVFSSLGMEQLKEIIELMIEEVNTEVREKNMEITYSEAAVAQLLKRGYDPQYGARPLRRTIQTYIEDQLAELYLKGIIKNGSKIHIDLDDKGNFKFTSI